MCHLKAKKFTGSTMIKCKWEKTYCNKCYIFDPLAFEMQMVRICNPNETISIHLHKESLGDTSAIKWHGVNGVTCTNSVSCGNLLITVFAYLILTKNKMLKQLNYLKSISLYRDRDKTLAPWRQKLCCTVLPPGLFPTPLPGQSTGWLCR